MIGRSEKCHAEVLRRITDENTSRAHILVLRAGSVVSAYGRASTHEAFVDGLPARCSSSRAAPRWRGVAGSRGRGVAGSRVAGRGENAVRLVWQMRG